MRIRWITRSSNQTHDKGRRFGVVCSDEQKRLSTAEKIKGNGGGGAGGGGFDPR